MRALLIVVPTLALIVSTSLLGGTASVGAQPEPASKSDAGALRADLERVKNELEGIRGELRLIRELLLQRAAQPQTGQPAPARVVAKVTVGDNPTLGKTDAPLTIIEFSDYQCPFCRRFFENIEAGKLRYVFRDFPIDELHLHARMAAEAARCAGDQGRYWEMHDLLFQNQQALQPEQLRAYAQRLGLDVAAFGNCLETGKYRPFVQRNYDDGVSAGVRGTPSFFLGKTRPDDTIEGLLISGARPLNDFRQEIERLFAER